MVHPVRGNALQQRKVYGVIAVFRRNEILGSDLKCYLFTFSFISAVSAQNDRMILSRSQRGKGAFIIYDNINILSSAIRRDGGSVVAFHKLLRIVEYDLAASVDIRILL